VVSFVVPLSATRPVTSDPLSMAMPIAGAPGAVVSMVTWNAVEAAPWLPATSLALAVNW